MAKWDIKKKNEWFWQASPTPKPEITLAEVITLILIFLFIKFY